MIDLAPETVVPYGVVVTRVSGIMAAAPAFSSVNVPMKVRVFTALALTFFLTPIVRRHAEPRSDEILTVLVMEFCAGLAIGLAFRWTLSAMSVAGELMGLQMGLGIASTLDPMAGSNALFTDAWLALTYTVVFLSLNGHHEVIRALTASYTVLPAGQPAAALSSPETLVQQTGQIFIVGLRIAAGMMIPLMLVTLAMALVSRAFPQANVFAISYTVTLILGLVLLAGSSETIRRAVIHGISDGLRNASQLIVAAQ
ncbi:MAG: flagellar biosynthetic protein FliR [Planctomycetota bacterium]|nr:flagellar biosynthetic protein FliR [Planctomycetota bacterium]